MWCLLLVEYKPIFIALDPLHNEYILMVPGKDGDFVRG